LSAANTSDLVALDGVRCFDAPCPTQQVSRNIGHLLLLFRYFGQLLVRVRKRRSEWQGKAWPTHGSLRGILSFNRQVRPGIGGLQLEEHALLVVAEQDRIRTYGPGSDARPRVFYRARALSRFSNSVALLRSRQRLVNYCFSSIGSVTGSNGTDLENP